MKTTTSNYNAQAKSFLTKWGIEFSVKRGTDACPPSCDGKHVHGDQYRVTLKRRKSNGVHGEQCECTNCCPFVRLTFPFWNSQHDSLAGNEPTAYDVLACISSDLGCPQGFEEFCSEYGYDQDSIKAMKTFTRCRTFSVKLNAFFENEEMCADLGTIN